MHRWIRVFYWGMLISFAGSLPLGTMNVAATQITSRDGTGAALIYAFGSMLIELIYVRAMVGAMEWVNKQVKIFKLFGWITILILFIMAIASFHAAANMSDIGSALPAISRFHFFYGMLLSAINPLHIPFWFGWSTVLMNKGILSANKSEYNFYIAGIGIGTIAGFTVFIYGSNYLVPYLKNQQHILNWVIGSVLLITALVQVYKLMYKSPELKYKI